MVRGIFFFFFNFFFVFFFDGSQSARPSKTSLIQVDRLIPVRNNGRTEKEERRN